MQSITSVGKKCLLKLMSLGQLNRFYFLEIHRMILNILRYDFHTYKLRNFKKKNINSDFMVLVFSYTGIFMSSSS